MNLKNIWVYGAVFFLGAFVCYITLQFSLFEIKSELDIPNILISLITMSIGLYIADTLQRRVNKNQNQHSYLINKLDTLWAAFNDFSEKLSFDSKIDATSIKNFNKEIIYPISFLKNVFNSFEVNNNCVCDLEKNLEKLDSILTNIPADNNVVDYSDHLPSIENKVTEISKCFSKILTQIQKL